MSNLWRPDDGSILFDTLGGFNVYTLTALLSLVVVVIVVRTLTMRFSPALLRTIIRSESITNKTVRDSDKSLGVAAGAVASGTPACLAPSRTFVCLKRVSVLYLDRRTQRWQAP